MRQGGELLVLLKVLVLVLVNSRIQLIPLLLEVLNLALIRAVLCEFDLGKALLELADLPLESFDVLLLHADLMLDLRCVALLVLLQVSEVALQNLDFDVFVASLFTDASFELLLLRSVVPTVAVLFFFDSLLTLLGLYPVEALYLN